MTTVVERNRAVLKCVDNWIDETSFRTSVFEYGIEDVARRTINKPLSLEANLTDLVSYAAARTKDLRYLEIGVSVGKTFWQIMNIASNASLTGYDIEELNPVLRKRLMHLSSRQVEGPSSEIKRAPAHLDRFEYLERSNRVNYLSADVHDANAWKMLSGDKYNLLFSDAAHRADAVLCEWYHLTSLDLLDRSGFTMIWDDLASRPMRKAFNRIVTDCMRIYGLRDDQACFTHVHGWLGEGEPKHPVGIVSTNGFVSQT
jgi:hypothetical protein